MESEQVKCSYEGCHQIQGDCFCGQHNNGKLPPANFFKHKGSWYCNEHLVRQIEDEVGITGKRQFR